MALKKNKAVENVWKDIYQNGNNGGSSLRCAVTVIFSSFYISVLPVSPQRAHTLLLQLKLEKGVNYFCLLKKRNLKVGINLENKSLHS